MKRSLAIVTSLFACACVCAGQAPERAQDLRYGIALYEYYQGNHFQALSELSVAKELNQLTFHADSATLTEGGIALALGLQNQSETVFSQLLAEKNAEALADQPAEKVPQQLTNAQLYLAKLNYRKGNYAKSEQLLKAVKHSSEAPEVSGLWSLTLNSHLKNQQWSQAQALLNSTDEFKPAPSHFTQALGYYNVANALANQEQCSEAQKYYQDALDQLANIDKTAQVDWVLQDKIHTSSGYCFYLSKQYDEAMVAFRQVGLDSRWANKALLGYGWAALSAQFYTESLRPWQALVNRDPLDANVQEALLALPYSLEKLQKNAQALIAYQGAETHFNLALSQVSNLRQRIENESLSNALHKALKHSESLKDGNNFGWLYLAPLPEQLPETNHYLTELLRSTRFQQQLIDLRDLLQLQDLFRVWKNKSTNFADLLKERETKRQDILARQELGQFPKALEQLEKQLEQAQVQLNTIEQNQDFLALSEGDTGELATMASGLNENADVLMANDQLDDESIEKINRLQGLVLWQSAEDYGDNLWRKKKQLASLSETVNAAKDQHQRTLNVINTAPALTPLNNKLSILTPQIDQQLVELTAAIDLQESQLRQDLIAHLETHRARLQHYLAYSQLSIARLYDDFQNPEKPSSSLAEPQRDDPEAIDQ